MNEVKTPLPLETWTAAEAQLVVEYPARILEAISAYAAEGLKRLSRSGIAVGGVLFGSRAEKSVRILAWRPISCEHAKGAAFALTQQDSTTLAQLLHNAKDDPELEGMHAIGWFVSHTREGVSLSESDLEIYSHFFPWSWQITLVVRPFRDRPAQAGFFVRDTQGLVKSDASHHEFQVDSTIAPVDRAGDTPVVADYQHSTREAARHIRFPVAAPSRPAIARPAFYSNRQLWIWVSPVILALLVWAMLRAKPAPPSVLPQSLGLHAFDAGGRFYLDWDKAAQPVRNATRATLSVRDGDLTPLQLDLDATRLAAGRFFYARKSADVDAVLTVFSNAGPPVTESTRFVGPPVNQPWTDDPAQLGMQRDTLERENEQLKEDLRRETSRNRELEDAIKALKNRLDLGQAQKSR